MSIFLLGCIKSSGPNVHHIQYVNLQATTLYPQIVQWSSALVVDVVFGQCVRTHIDQEMGCMGYVFNYHYIHIQLVD